MTTQKADPNDPATASTILDSMFGPGAASQAPAPAPVQGTPPQTTPPAESPAADPPVGDEPSLFDDPDKGKPADQKNPYAVLASDYGLEPPEGEEDFQWDYDTLKTGIDQKIEQSAKTLNLEEYDPDARKVIEFFTEKKGNLVDFYKNNELAEAEKLKGMSDQQLWELNAINGYVKMGFSEAEAKLKVDTDIETLGERSSHIFKAFADTARLNLDKYSQQIINNLIEEKNKFIEQENAKKVQKAGEERKNMVKELSKMTSYMGITLSEKDKAYIAKEIESGKFLEKISASPARSQLYSYLSTVLQQKIVQTYENILRETAEKEKSRSLVAFLQGNYNAAPSGQVPQASGAGFRKDDPKTVQNWLDSIIPK